MRFLADESCDFAVVRALREAGHDVTAIAELTPAATDDAVLSLARSEERVLLTEDKDFGVLAYAGGQQTAGVILIRFPSDARSNGNREFTLKLDANWSFKNRLSTALHQARLIAPGTCVLPPACHLLH